MNKKSEEELINSDDSLSFDSIEAPELEPISTATPRPPVPPPSLPQPAPQKAPEKPKKKSDNIFKRMARGLVSDSPKQAKKKPQKPQKSPSQVNKMVDEIKANLGGMDLSRDSSFLQKIQKNEVLKKGFANVKIMEQVGLISKNPQLANEFSKDPQFKEFFSEYMKLLGNTFQEKGAPPPKRETFSIQKTGNPRIDSILEDPEIQKLLLRMRRGERVEMYSLARANPQLVEKMKVLMHCGYLQAHAQ